jgi:V8-like Glu-specific endopeptidase
MRLDRSMLWMGGCLLVVSAVAVARPGRVVGEVEDGDNPHFGTPQDGVVSPDAPVREITAPGFSEAQIVGGTNVEGEAYQSVVFLEMQGASGAEGMCTGSLIHPNWILTAAHCIDSTDITGVTVSFGNGRGEFFKTATGRPAGLHPSWLGTLDATIQGDFEGDIGLIRLDTPVTDVTPMSLNKQEVNSDWINDPVTFIGFGITEHQGGGTGTKREAQVEISGTTSYSFVMPAGPQSTCQGDSGGPGVKIQGNNYTQIGITSNGQECGSGSSEAMRVDAYMDWILEKMAPDEPQTGFAADPTFRCSNEVTPGDPNTTALGQVPFDLKCVVDFYLADKIKRVEWAWGDGTVEELTTGDLLRAQHVYNEAGSFNVRMCVEYERPIGDNGEVELANSCVKRVGYALACDVPAPAFSVRAVDTRTLAFDNLTSLETDRCFYDIAWDIFEGESASGTPVDTIESWQPVYEFESSGTYTVVLNIGGIGGTGAAALTLDVGKETRGVACGSLGGGGVGVFAAVGLLALRRRRS